MRKFLCTLFAIFMLLSPAVTPAAEAAQSWKQVYLHIEEMINRSVKEYESGNLEAAKKTINDSYYGIYEKDGLEKAIRTTISSKNANLTEYQYGRLKKAVRENLGSAKVQEEAGKLLDMMSTDIKSLENKSMGGGKWASFWPAFLIILREGMEAILMLVAIIAYLSKTGNEKYLNTVYNYATAAILASFITAYIFSAVMGRFAAGASQELIEGITALFAVVVLLSVSVWMSGKASAQSWKNYIEGIVKQSITSGKARALGIAAFLAVYREGAEVILFFQALFNGASGDTEMIWFGFGAGCIVLLIIFFVIQKGLLKIPMRPFFIVTGLLMFLLAVTFAGSGVSELQEAGVVSQTVIESASFPNIDWLGLYPTYETVGAQAAILIFGVVVLLYRHMKGEAA